MSDLVLQHCTVDMQRGKVHKQDGSEALTNKEVELLRYLSERPNEVITRDELLVEVWGYREGVYSRAVDTTMRRLRNKLEQTPAEPDHLTTVHGEGYRYIPPSQSPVVLAAAPTPAPSRTLPAVARPSNALIGRGDELEKLQTLMADGARLISVVGPGGMGKSRLVLELLHADTSLTPVHVQMIEGGSEIAVLEALADKIHLALDKESEDASAITHLGHALAQQGPLLLFIDDLDGDRSMLLEAVDSWLRQAQALRVIITTRTRTQLQAEQIVELGSLSESDGVALFVERARLLRPDFAPDSDEHDTIGELVGALDGMPLAIELAAARIRLMSPEQILIRLSGSITFLRGNRPGGTGHHTGLRTMMASAWEELDGPEQQVLAGCTVFRSGFSLDAAEAVIGPVLSGGDVLEIVEDLVDTSWLRAVESPHGIRFEQYSTLRVFIENQTTAAAQLATLRHAHMDWFLAQSESRADNLEDRADAKDMAWLEAERANIMAAVLHAAQVDSGKHARLLRGLIESDVARGAVWELNGLLDTLGSLAPETPAVDAAALYTQRAHARRFIGRVHESKEDIERALVLAEESGDADAICGARYTACWIDWDLRDFETVQAHLAVMAQRAPEGNQARWDIRRLFMQAWADARSGRLPEALAAGQRSIQLATQENEPRRVAMTHQVMAQVVRDLDNMSDAIAHTQKAAEIFEQIGDIGNVGYAKNALAMLYAVDGRLAEAEPLLVDAREIIRDRHDVHGLALLEGNLGAIRLGLDDLEAASQSLWECLRILDAAGIPRGRGFYAAYLGATRALMDEASAAGSLMDEAERSLTQSDFGGTQAFMVAIRAHLSVGEARQASQRGEADAAAAHLEAARTQGLPPQGERLAVGVVGFAQQLLQRAIAQS